jgi:nucleoid DNA-binding protein/cell division septation protein DedD
VKLAKYIHDLLLENETVIIPGLGAFISTYKPAEIGDNEIKPPSKEVSFSNQIRNNDGILVSAIARKAKISQPNALKRIERERENILYQLDKGEEVVVEDLGVLIYNEKNEISFTPFQKDNLLLDSFGFLPISMDDIVEEVIEPESDAVIAEQLTEPEKTEIISENDSETEMKSTVFEPAGEEFEEPVVEQKTETTKLPENKFDPLIIYPEKRKKAVWYLYLLILIPIIIGGYFILNKIFNKNINENYNETSPQVKKQEVIIQTITPSSSEESDSITENKVIETVKTETAENPILTDSKYYLVGGGFKKEENAEKFILRLKESGIEGFMLGQKGSLYLVGIGSFNTESEAYNSLNEHVKKYPDWNLWVFEK